MSSQLFIMVGPTIINSFDEWMHLKVTCLGILSCSVEEKENVHIREKN